MNTLQFFKVYSFKLCVCVGLGGCVSAHTQAHTWKRECTRLPVNLVQLAPTMGAGNWTAVLCKGSNTLICWAIHPAWRPFINTDTNSSQELHHERTALNKQCTYGIKFTAYLKPQNKDHNNNNKKNHSPKGKG